MKKLFVIVEIILFGISFSVAHAQTVSPSTVSPTIVPSGVPQAAIGKYNITFPVAELGNCIDFVSCKAYCDDITHTDACVAYAKNKGFYQPNPLETNKQQILAAAQNILGCDSVSSCIAFCQIPTNITACTEFAQKYNLPAGNVSKLSSASTLQQAQEQLGCNSAATCKTFCEDKANEQKCTAFAQSIGLRGGLAKINPSGASGMPMQGNSLPAENTPPSIPAGSNPQAACSARPHCIWTGTLCKCVQVSTSGETPAITSNESSSTTQTITTTSTSGSGQIPSMIPQVKTNSVSTQNPFPTVKGIATQRTWVEQILHFLFGV